MKLFLCCLLCLPPAAFAAEKASEATLTIHVDSFHLVSIGRDRAEAEVNLSIKTDMDARIERIEFSNFHANGVPFFAQPLETAIDVHRGESLGLPPIAVSVYTGDLDSLDPLIAIVDERQTHLQAELSVRVQATMLEHLVLGEAHPLAVLAIDQDVEVQPPGGLLGGVSAMALLKAAQIAMAGAAHLPVRLSSSDPAWQTQMDLARSALLHARNCYMMDRKKGANEVCVDQLAFAVGPREAIATAELGTPWRFDPRLAKAFADQGGRLQAGDPRITLQGIDPASPAAASAATFQQAGEAAAIKLILLPSRSRLSLLSRSSPGLYGRLATTGTGAAFQASAGQVSGDRLAIFRLAHTPEGAWQARVLYLSGTVSGQTITFSRPVDRSAIGSPILTPRGVIGVVQTENGGTLLAARSAN